MSFAQDSWSSVASTDRPMILTLRLSNSGCSLAMYPSSVVHTGVKSFGCENSTAHESPIQSWKLIWPSVVSASKSGAVSPMSKPIPSVPLWCVLRMRPSVADDTGQASVRSMSHRGGPTLSPVGRRLQVRPGQHGRGHLAARQEVRRGEGRAPGQRAREDTGPDRKLEILVVVDGIARADLGGGLLDVQSQDRGDLELLIGGRAHLVPPSGCQVLADHPQPLQSLIAIDPHRA